MRFLLLILVLGASWLTWYRASLAEARLELARCRKAIAEKQPTGRDEALAKAQRDIEVTYRLYPQLGGDEMRAAFDALLKQIQKDLGKPADGLAAIDGVAAR